MTLPVIMAVWVAETFVLTAPSHASRTRRQFPFLLSLRLQWKQQAMYELRAAIRDRQSVAEGYARVDKIPGKISESLMHQALLARDPEDGQNLMAYAARWGREEWFLYLVQHVRDKVRHSVHARHSTASGLNSMRSDATLCTPQVLLAQVQ